MDRKMIAICGTYCGTCDWKDKMNCKGCQECKGDMFHGECSMAKCCISKGFEHCGLCPDVPCQKLLDLFADPEHGDDGSRLRNLKRWANGDYTLEESGEELLEV